MPYAHEEFIYQPDRWNDKRKFLVEFFVVPGDSGVDRYANGDPGYPPSPGHIEIVKVTYENSNVEMPQRMFNLLCDDMEKEAWNVINSKLKELI